MGAESNAARRVPPPTAREAYRIAGKSDVGLRRAHNEDATWWDARLGAAIVADGMGGKNAGEVASGLAVQSMRTDLHQALADQPRRGESAGLRERRGALLGEVVRRANQRILQAAQRDEHCRGMGTTVVAALLADEFVTVASVGDSRAYLLRAGRLRQLTNDHSMAQELVQRGQLTEEQASRSRHQSVLTRALGMAPDMPVDVAHYDLAEGDLILLCSDGLTRMLPDREIEALLNQHRDDIGSAVTSAVEHANHRGGHDNVSVVLLQP